MNIRRFERVIVYIIYFAVFGKNFVFCKTNTSNLVLDKNVVLSVKSFVRDNYENSKNLCNNLCKKGCYAKNKRDLINNFYSINKSNGALDYTFKNISKDLTKSVLDEYLACRCIDYKIGVNVKAGMTIRHAVCDGAGSSTKNNLKNCFDWCACRKARASTRLYLVFEILNKLAGRDKSKELVYVSFGSGKLLQDYLIINGLSAAGFKNLNINLIDLGYANSSDICKNISKRVNNCTNSCENSGNNNGLDVDNFLQTFCRKHGEKSDEKDALCAFCKLARSCKCIKKINTYTTYFDFLQKRSRTLVDVLLLIDPMKLFAELLETKDHVYVNHVRVKIGRSFEKNWVVQEIIFLLPYNGRPEVFYKAGKGGISGCIGLDNGKKACLLHCINSYKSYSDRANFIKSLDLCLNWSPIWPSKLCDLEKNKKIVIETSQSQRYSFYNIIKSTVSKSALIYQLDDNKIFSGVRNLLTDAYKKEGYKRLK